VAGVAGEASGGVEHQVLQGGVDVGAHELDDLVGVGADDPPGGDLLDGQVVGEALHLLRVRCAVLLLGGERERRPEAGVFPGLSALAQFELELVRERTLAGLAAARERVRLGGRPTALTPAKLKQARRMLREGTSVTEVAQVLEVSRATLYRRVRELAESQRKRQAPVQRDVPITG